MSDQEYNSEPETFSVERQPEKKTRETSVKQKRTPAQLEALRQARLTRSLKAKQRRDAQQHQEEPINLTYLAGMALLSAGALGAYYYVKQQPNAKESPINLTPKKTHPMNIPSTPAPTPVVVPETPKRQVVQRIINPVKKVSKQVEELVAKEIEKIKAAMPAPTPAPEPTPTPTPTPVPEPVVNTKLNDFLKGAREL